MSEEKYYTLDELMEGKKPGEIRVRNVLWNDARGWWFKPYFKDRDGDWIGLNQRNSNFCPVGETQKRVWKLYTEPKKKVVRWLWAFKASSGNWFVQTRFYSDKEAERVSEPRIKLEHTRTEFDE